ncbi:MAG: hypothetical protein GVY36_17335 [Verrucomicrobia bacterium]|jgi:hypothetical protein|nr:hypothetical protein [Verrucomicrobiota bacterium]
MTWDGQNSEFGIIVEIAMALAFKREEIEIGLVMDYEVLADFIAPTVAGG